MRRIRIDGELSVEELETRYRAAKAGAERSQWQIIWLLAQGKPSEEVQAVTGYSLDWIRTLARRYNAAGAAGIGDRRHQNPGRGSALKASQQAALKQAIMDGRTRGEHWDGKRVAAWISECVGRPIHMQRGYEWLAKLGFSKQVPRPQHTETKAEDQQVFKKSFPKP
jgi:transposase